MAEIGGAIPRADVLAHLRRFLGPSPGRLAAAGLFEVHVFGPSHTRPWLTLATLGLCEVNLTPPANDPDRRYQELLLYLPADWDVDNPDPAWRWPAHLLIDLAQQAVDSGKAPYPGQSVTLQRPPRPFGPGTLLSAAVFNRPGREERENPEFDPLFVGRYAVSFLWAIPLTTAENALAVNEGYDKLLERMAEVRVPYEVDAARACIVTGRRPGAATLVEDAVPPAPPEPDEDVSDEDVPAPPPTSSPVPAPSSPAPPGPPAKKRRLFGR